MRYYIKHKDNKKVEGPYSVEEINQLIDAGRIGAEWWATSDIGEPMRKVVNSADSDWWCLSKVPGIAGVHQTARGRLEAGNFFNWLILLAVLFLVLVLIVFFLIGASLSNVH